MQEFTIRYRRIMMEMEKTAREKQVNVQVECLNKAVAELQGFTNGLETSLHAILSPEQIAEEDKDKEALKTLCEHAEYMRTKTNEITEVAHQLGRLIIRLEI